MLIVEVLGGIGLFLLGITLMTEGLQDAAADRLRSLLIRLTGGRLRGTVAGASITLLVQSSTATTLATIGFVSAGLLTFQQSIAVIIGSNIGTTSTGWIVALLGFKVQVSTIALPMIAAGALLRMLGHGHLRPIGLAIAGFGVIFVGLDLLQSGMAEVATRFDLGGIDGGSLWTRLILVAIGIAMTVVMQSSSAAIATTLAAVHSEAIGLPAAAALLVGQNVGTTATAALASIGATVPAKRTAAAHVMFNVVTACVVFVLLPLVPWFSRVTGLDDDPALFLAAFHTGFSLLGAIMLLPLIAPFATIITHMIPERRPSFTRNLDISVASMPSVAVDASRRAVLGAYATTFDLAGRMLLRGSPLTATTLTQAREAMHNTRDFLSHVHTGDDSPEVYDQHLSVLHAIDHSERFLERLNSRSHAVGIRDVPDIRVAAEELGHVLADAARWCAVMADVGDHEDQDNFFVRDALERIAGSLSERREDFRVRTLEQTARGECTPAEAMEWMDAVYWVERLSYHAWRAMHHLSRRPDPVAEMGE